MPTANEIPSSLASSYIFLVKNLNAVILFLAMYALMQHALSQSLLPQTSCRIALASADSIYTLPYQFIERNSESVLLDSVQLLHDSLDYTLNTRKGTITFVKHLFADSLPHYAIVTFRSLPLRFRDFYFHRELIYRKDSVTQKEIGFVQEEKKFSLDDVFGDNLQKSGSISRGFTIGTNRDFSLQSGFRMQLQGNISEDVSILAALSDENTPLQPEGSTQTLSEIDKIFVEITHPNFSATLGDFDFQTEGTEFGNINRKLQGAKGSAAFTSSSISNSVLLAGATSRGKFTTNQFSGLDGVQGPYHLYGKNNERAIIIIAGSERVYVNGEEMVRGDNRDYIIDYATAELTFTTRRLISNISRIVVDFEYTDRQYARNFFGVANATQLFGNTVALSLRYYREGDDADAPLDVTLTDDDKNILRNAGSNRTLAAKDGWRSDSLGNYIRMWSVVASESVFVYKPDTNGVQKYTITFTFVGNGQGDYERKSIGNFEYAGNYLGSYVAKVFLPMPELHQAGTIKIDVNITDSLKIESEFAASNFDANRFSPRNDEENFHPANKFSLRYQSKEIKHIGRFSINAKNRFIDGGFATMERIDDAEYARRWNFSPANNNNEELSEGTIGYMPAQFLQFNVGAGNLMRDDESIDRTEGKILFAKKNLPSFYYAMEKIQNIMTPSLDIGSTSSVLRQQGNTEWSTKNAIPSFRYANETRKDFDVIQNKMSRSSFRFNEFAPKLILQHIWNTQISAEVQVRNEDSIAALQFTNASRAITQRYEMTLYEIQNFSTTLNVTLQRKKYSDVFALKGNKDNATHLFRWLGRYSPMENAIQTDWLYEATTQRSAKAERIFVKVPQGTGNYIYIGDRDSNGIRNDADFEQTRFDGDYIVTSFPSEALYPVIDLRTNVRVKILYGALFEKELPVLSKISSESYFRIEEKNSTPHTSDIYFLKLNRFLNDSTIAGSQLMTHDVFWNETDELFSLRLRFQQKKSLTQFALATERNYIRERSARMRIQLDKEISNQTEFINTTNTLSANVSSNRVRNISGNALSSDFSYRPQQQFEFGFKMEIAQNNNAQIIVADMNTQEMRFTFSFEDKGQLRLELHREEVQFNKINIDFPFELTNGRLQGKTFLWKVMCDYRIAEYLQTTFSYDGRKEGTRETVHTARAELRATF